MGETISSKLFKRIKLLHLAFYQQLNIFVSILFLTGRID